VSGLEHVFGRPGAGSAQPGVAVGLVTSNADPEGQGRVKVRFPALSDTLESTWASVVTPMAGSGRGLYLMPEEGDTVLVAFEQGDVDRPFVLGGFWAGREKPPQTGHEVRVLRSRSGHVVRLDDTDGAERIEIVDRTGNNSITIETATNEITVHAAGPVTVAADGDLSLTAKGRLELSGQEVTVSAKAKLALSGTAAAELTSDGALTVRGSTVDIN
jgi:uncharacterized protein involved in type VI secretion and phage assembly